ncbi:MAG: CopG family transcriptional regulator [Chloroflexi bacterium]|nr:CopG family transcriptional regulator [Chloroflexota bacterium]
MKTTIYVPDELKAALQRRAQIERRSESDIIREALRQATAGFTSPRPHFPIGEGAGPSDLSERVDEYLNGFGE